MGTTVGMVNQRIDPGTQSEKLDHRRQRRLECEAASVTGCRAVSARPTPTTPEHRGIVRSWEEPGANARLVQSILLATTTSRAPGDAMSEILAPNSLAHFELIGWTSRPIGNLSWEVGWALVLGGWQLDHKLYWLQPCAAIDSTPCAGGGRSANHIGGF
eukprot:scaffold215902_cov31-Tisochrysis_lutea.AAC.7